MYISAHLRVHLEEGEVALSEQEAERRLQALPDDGARHVRAVHQGGEAQLLCADVRGWMEASGSRLRPITNNKTISSTAPCPWSPGAAATPPPRTEPAPGKPRPLPGNGRGRRRCSSPSMVAWRQRCCRRRRPFCRRPRPGPQRRGSGACRPSAERTCLGCRARRARPRGGGGGTRPRAPAVVRWCGRFGN